MPKNEDIKAKYLQDADAMGSKSRFGFFSIPPCATAGVTAFQQKKVEKDENGRVRTQQRNIFSGPTASGVLKKNYFEYSKSVFQGDQYKDPGKQDRVQQLEKNKKITNPDVYKPLSLAKTPNPKASYEYIPQQPKKKIKKDVIDQDGKVITEERNITTNPQSKIEKERRKENKYVPDQYGRHLKLQRDQMFKSIGKRGEAPFKSSSPTKDYFQNNKKLFGSSVGSQSQRKDKSASNNMNNMTAHDSAFRPSCTKKYDTFSYPEYLPGGLKQKEKQATTVTQRQQTFKLTKQPNNHKPSPSITTMKSNILRKIR